MFLLASDIYLVVSVRLHSVVTLHAAVVWETQENKFLQLYGPIIVSDVI